MSGQDVVFYGSSPWDETWLTEHYLAEALSRDGRVLFVDPAFSVLTVLKRRRGVQAVRGVVELLAAPTRTEGEVTVVRTSSLPKKENALVRRASAPWRRAQVARAVKAAGLDVGVVVTAAAFDDSTWIPRGAVKVAIVKDWLEAGAHLTGLSAQVIRERQRRTWEIADVVCAISTRLVARLAEEGVTARLLRHGSLAGRFGSTATQAVPEPLERFPRPLIGAVGRVDSRWDHAALAEVADRNPGGSVLLIGPVSQRIDRAELDALLRRPNVHLLPPVPNTEVPAWVEALDCSTVPYVDDPWQQYASPLKIWDYLRAGTPIAATGCPALGEFPEGLVHFSLPSRDLPKLVEAALAEPARTRAERRTYAAANTWDDRAAQLREIVAETVR
ncbi:glycosyltransferase [Kineococcus sp. R86509]|uniref:glycosyltransferase n=1 Tax=Kineococcus sp. R86509 TaxID=3093851 RepID=UPI0036D308EC